jgi:4-oxalocrotonate tautomerase
MMPIVQIELWEGRTDEQKAQLIDAVSDAFRVLDIRKDHVIIVIHETPRSNWGLGGLHSSK